MRLALIRLSALGDVVHTWPLAIALKRGRPDLHLTWVVEAPFRPLVDGHPAVDEVVTVATGRWRRAPFAAATRRETAAARSALRAIAADLALDPQGTVKSAWITRLTGAAARVGLQRPWRREAVAGLAYTGTLPGSSGDPHVVATNLALAAAVNQPAAPGVPHPDGSWLAARYRGRRQSLPPGRQVAVFLPGAGRPTKIVPAATLGAVARGLASDGLDTVVAWGPGERGRAEAVVAEAAGAASLAPPTDLGELVVLLDEARLVVGGDTGPVHLAASLGTPTVGVFLTTDWRRNGPLGPATAVVSGADLATRVSASSARAPFGRHPSAAEILDAARRLLVAPCTVGRPDPAGGV